ncbi:hypothetical protein CVT24_000552 [Panaeolus cyanescens]|uniref:Transmembrane protein n=1 Tax=Panaeolus cyanescens TaxID=181874 RepID=A0A409VX89_9AGAR|nr:hypothetical protein CVT24_000552 [Panaeolus cyanescens]
MAPTAPHPVFFPSPGLQMMCALVYFIGGLLVFGVGLEYSKAVCISAIYVCVIFYSSAKFFVYAFLAEKVHIVWSPTVGIRRFESPVYLTCIVSVSLYCIVMTLMLGGPIYETADNGACVIGLKPLASIPLLVYDIYINLFLTFMFVYPLVRSRLMSSGVRRLAIRTCIAALVALTTSTINIVILIVMNGRELAWVNLTACSGDIIVNAVAIFWVSGRKSNKEFPSSGGLPPERGRRLNNHHNPQLSGGQIGDIAFSVGSKSSVSNQTNQDHQLVSPVSPAAGTSSFTPMASFPKYFDSDNEDGKSKSSWFRRFFFGDKKSRDLRIAVTTEHERVASHSHIELDTRPDSTSEIENKPSDLVSKVVSRILLICSLSISNPFPSTAEDAF